MIIYLFVYLLLFIGVNCTWSSNSILEVDLRYCKDPVNYHVHFKDPGLNVDNNFNIGENDEKVLYEKRYIITIKIKVTKLRRSQNTVATSVRAKLVFVIFN